jgi:nucleotide-binding universal stress UspA family protein
MTDLRGQVLCAVDDDDLAADVLAVAVAFAELIGGGLTLVHVLPSHPVPGLVAPEADKELRRLGVQEGAEFFARLSEGLAPAAGATERLEIGDASDRILALAEELSVAAIVLGRSRTLRARLLGSVSSHVIDRAHCPVVLVPRADRD